MGTPTRAGFKAATGLYGWLSGVIADDRWIGRCHLGEVMGDLGRLVLKESGEA